MQLSNFLSNNRGASAVEFAVVLPVLLVVLCGIYGYGVYIGASHSVAQLAADAARASVAGLSDEEREQIASEHVARSAGDYLLLTADKVKVTAAPSPGDPSIFQVAVNFDAADLPIFGLEHVLPLPSKTIMRTASIRRGGV